MSQRIHFGPKAASESATANVSVHERKNFPQNIGTALFSILDGKTLQGENKEASTMAKERYNERIRQQFLKDKEEAPMVSKNYKDLKFIRLMDESTTKVKGADRYKLAQSDDSPMTPASNLTGKSYN